MNFSIGNKITIGFIVALLALLIIAVVTSRNLKELENASKWVNHSFEVKQELKSLFSDLLMAESSGRGYQLSGNPQLLKAYEGALLKTQAHVQNLDNLTKDNKGQQAFLGQLRPLLDRRQEELRKLVELPRVETGAGADRRAAVVNDGSQLMDQILALTGEMGKEEDRLLKERLKISSQVADFTSNTIIYGSILACLIVGTAGFVIARSIVSPLRTLGESAEKIGGGDYSHRVAIASRDEVGNLANIFNRMAEQVEKRQTVLAEQDWMKTGLNKFSPLFQGQRDAAVVCREILSELASLLDARHSVLYLAPSQGESRFLKLQGSYAADHPKQTVQPGEGLVGQCYLDKIRVVLTEIPADYIKVSSVLGEAKPAAIVVQPVLFYGEVKAVLELALLAPPTPIQLEFLGELADNIGIVLNTIEGIAQTESLLQQSQLLSENLKARQAELEEQTDKLRVSERQLQDQQEELKQTNEELEQANEEMQQTNEEMEEKVNLLAEQKKEMERANREIEEAREELEEKARQIARASQYKSEFLANMSHELRTPLNSLLILSKMLADNPGNTLSEKQVQYAQTIHSSGNDLLELINEILDLAKIESGSVVAESREIKFSELEQFVEQTFRHVAEQKHLDFRIHFDPSLPALIHTDGRRLEQVLKNLLSNAFKFTSEGSVGLKVAPVREGWDRDNEALNHAAAVIAFEVRDTGIGISPEKQKLIFEAFQQADAGTARKYGGTGLGLSISREIADLLGGALQVKSKEGGGSTFTLFLPVSPPEGGGKASKAKSPKKEAAAPAAAAPRVREPNPEEAGDDRENLRPGDLILLIIEDDIKFARLMMEFARNKKFKVLLARTVSEGLALANRFQPSAITLDLHLPDNDGWVVLDQLKHNLKTRHIPIHVISVDEERERSLRLGAVSYFQKPATKETIEEALNQTIEFINRPLKNLLVIEDDPVQRQSLIDLIGNGDVKSEGAGSAAEAFAALEKKRFDCVVLDLGLPDMDGKELIQKIHEKYGPHAPPIIVYTGRELSREEETELRMVSESIIIKNVRSPERLLDETALFLHRVQTKLPEAKRRMIEEVRKNESILAGRKVLVVDDDVRNIFAITSALESSQMQVIYAESGKGALEMLAADPDIDIVLMDVMMPEMDGFEAIREIRKMERFRKLPIISVTAKAMGGDREKCLAAGASDYITKPVDMDQLRSLLRVWLYQ